MAGRKKTNSLRVITFFANKGGNGKTTSAVMFASILEAKGYRVLLIDNDGQANASDFTGAPLIPQKGVVRIENLYESINTKTPDIKQKIDINLLRDAIQNTEIGYDYIESSKILDSIMPKLKGDNVAYTLWRIRAALTNTYDFCIIDSPCKADVLSANSIIAADDVIIPVATEGDTEKTLVNNVFLFKDLEREWNAKANIDRVMPVKIKTPSHARDIIPQIEQFAETNYKSKLTKSYVKYSTDIENCMLAREHRIECIKSGRSSDAFIAYIENVEEYLKDHDIQDDSQFTVLEFDDVYGNLKKKIVTEHRDVVKEYQTAIKAFLKNEGVENKIYTETNPAHSNLPRYKIIVNIAKDGGKKMSSKECEDILDKYLTKSSIPYILKIKDAAAL